MNGLFFRYNPVGFIVQLEKVHCYLSLLHFLTRHCLILIVVPAQLDVFKKALLMGAVFLIDFNYFERNRNQ